MVILHNFWQIQSNKYYLKFRKFVLKLTKFRMKTSLIVFFISARFLVSGRYNAQFVNEFFTLEARNPNKFLGQEAMIGQYAHGNEPGHHVVYLYAYSNTPKTGQKFIHRFINEFHNNTPNGMIGNDDCGQMSAWYILSSLGFYPVNPTGDEFVSGSPQLKKATLHQSKGKQLVIESKNFSETSFYNDTRILNGIQIKTPFITYKEIMNGGSLKFIMTIN
jgi:putative alpha-1,2-mannosidase